MAAENSQEELRWGKERWWLVAYSSSMVAQLEHGWAEGEYRVQWLGHHPNLRRLALVGEVVVHWLPKEQVE